MPIKILSIDDEPDMQELLKMKYRKQIRNEEYEFHFANHGAEALEIVKNIDDISLILCDINMPVMDGLTFLEHIKELKKPATRTIMVSAYSEMGNLRAAMNRGAFDFVTKPIDFEDLDVTIKKTLLYIEEIKQAIENEQQLSSLVRDLDIAKKIQLSLLPQKYPPFPNRSELEIYGSMTAAKDVGGDLYDFFWIDQNRIAFIIADVSGKGIPAAIFMATARSVIKTVASKGNPPELTMFEANNLICQESVDSMFITTFYGIFNVLTGEFVYCNAGHTQPHYIDLQGNIKFLDRTGDLVLGAMDGVPYHSKSISLQKGEGIFMYTDGVTEATSPENELFGDARLHDYLSEFKKLSLKELNNNILENLLDFADGTEQADDITILAFKYL